MILSPLTLRSALLLGAALLPMSFARAADPVQVVFQNGRSIPISSLALEADKLVIKTSGNGFTAGQSFPLTSADHIYGGKPEQINSGVALLLIGKPAEALKLLEPVVAEQRLTAKIPGNFWLEAARAALVAHAVMGNTAKTTEIGKEISDATPSQGIDPFVSLGKALLLPASTPVEDRGVALGDLTTDNLPADLAAYASFYRGNLLNEVKRDKDPAKALKQTMAALEAYLMVPTLYPAGSMVLNGVAEAKAAEILVSLGRREEAIALFNSSIRETGGTLVAVDSAKRLEELK
jgi:tetratricopeptide (TPR) repeat protein